MRAALAILAWTAMLLPWERCVAECHDRVELGAHECHPGGRCPQQPGTEDSKAKDERLIFDTVRPSPEPVAAPPPVAAPLSCDRTPAPVEVAPQPVAPPQVPRTTVLLL